MRLTPGSSVNDDVELGEVDLRLLAGRRLEARLKARQPRGPQLAQQVGDRGVAALIAALAQFAKQAAPGQGRKRGDPLAQIRREQIDETRPRRPRLVGRRLQAFGDVNAHSLAINSELAGDGGHREALTMQFQDHDEFPEFDHRALPPATGRSFGNSARRPAIPCMPGMAGRHENWGIFNRHFLRSLRPALTMRELRGGLLRSVQREGVLPFCASGVVSKARGGRE